jgi:hypothetical protein
LTEPGAELGELLVVAGAGVGEALLGVRGGGGDSVA